MVLGVKVEVGSPVCSDSSTITVSESDSEKLNSEKEPASCKGARKTYEVRKALHDGRKGRPLSLEQLLLLEVRKLEDKFSSKDQSATRLSTGTTG